MYTGLLVSGSFLAVAAVAPNVLVCYAMIVLVAFVFEVETVAAYRYVLHPSQFQRVSYILIEQHHCCRDSRVNSGLGPVLQYRCLSRRAIDHPSADIHVRAHHQPEIYRVRQSPLPSSRCNRMLSGPAPVHHN